MGYAAVVTAGELQPKGQEIRRNLALAGARGRIEPDGGYRMRPRLIRSFAVGVLTLSFAGGALIAQDNHDRQDHHDQYVQHKDWRKGQHIRQEDWSRGQRVDDWHTRHLRRPPRGYEWREIDGQYVLANSNGVILQVVVPR